MWDVFCTRRISLPSSPKDYRIRGISGISGNEKDDIANRRSENMSNVGRTDGTGPIDAKVATGTIMNPIASAAATFFIEIV